MAICGTDGLIVMKERDWTDNFNSRSTDQPQRMCDICYYTKTRRTPPSGCENFESHR